MFVFLLLAVEFFALFPLVRDALRMHSETAHLVLTGSLILLAFAMLRELNTLLAQIFIGLVLFIAFGIPTWFLSVLRYKREITGPWDIAKVTALN